MGDVRDANQIRNEIKGMDYVLHLSALIAIPYSYKAPQSYIDTNVTGTLNVLQAALDFDVAVIHTSRVRFMDQPNMCPLMKVIRYEVNHPMASKIAADQIAYSYFAFELPVKIIRPFNTWCPANRCAQ